MGRKTLAVGELGSIKTTRLAHRKYEALARVGTLDGSTKRVKGRGSTAELARARLQANARKVAYTGLTEGIDGNTTVDQLAQRTIANMRAGQGVKRPLRPQTIDQYETCVPLFQGRNPRYARISDLKLIDCTPSIIATWLETVSTFSPSTGKRCKAMLTHMFDLAIRHDVQLWVINPARAATINAPEHKEPVELSDADVYQIRERVLAWQTDMKRTDLWGIINAYIATGARPNEVLALRWCDVDLTSEPATATICGTIVRVKGKGLQYQAFPKTDAGFRTLTLPTWFAAMLWDRMVNSTSDWVFPNEDGGMLDSQNIAKRWADARGEEYAHVKLKTFRQAMATRLDRAYDSARAAAKQLGHTNTDVTRKHYIKKAHEAGDFTDVLDKLAPTQTVP